VALDDPDARTAETLRAGLVKGQTACNRSACQAPLTVGERYWNWSTRAYYCKSCADRINAAAKECGDFVTADVCIKEKKQ
jgi:hypothetical protein